MRDERDPVAPRCGATAGAAWRPAPAVLVAAALYRTLAAVLIGAVSLWAACHEEPKATLRLRLEDWDGRCPVPLIGANQLTRIGEGYDWSPENLSGVVRLRWDEENLYLAAQVTDDRHHARATDERTPEDDSLVLALHPQNRLPANASFCVEFIEGESMLMLLNSKGVAVSSGSACTSRALKASHVLIAMGIPHELAQGSLLFGFGLDNTPDDVDYVLEVLPPIVDRLRQMSPLYSKFTKASKGGK